VAAARSWIDTPYKKKGRDRKGLDCLGIVVMLARQFQIPHQDRRDYTNWPDPERQMLTMYSRYMRRAPTGFPFPGTIGVFTGNILPCHTGVFSMKDDKPHLIHARIDGHKGKVVEQEWREQDAETGEGRLVARVIFPGLVDDR